jgi:hypothetical protein
MSLPPISTQFILAVALTFATFHFPAVGESEELVCEPGQRASSQFDLGQSSSNASNLSSQVVLSSGFTHLRHGLVHQSVAPGDLYGIVEPVKESHTPRLAPTGALHPGPAPQFTGAIWFHDQRPNAKEVVWTGGIHSSGKVCNKSDEFQSPGEIVYAQHGFRLPPNDVQRHMSGIPHTARELESGGKVRRLLKVIRLVKRACLTYLILLGLKLINSRPTDHLCPGSAFCCPPTATCLANGCTVSQATPTCLTYPH